MEGISMRRKAVTALILLGILLVGGALSLAVTVANAQNVLNVLLIGTDNREEDETGRSDTMILARIDAGKGEVRLVSFVRYLYVNIPGFGKQRLNAAYRYGEEELLKETLYQNFGVQIDRTVTVDFSQLIDIVDEMGGVEVEIQPKERAEINKMVEAFGGSRLKGSGTIEQRLDGTQALCYSRIRKIDNDFQRSSRQQMVLSALLAQMRKKGPIGLMMTGMNLLEKIDTDITASDLMELLPVAFKVGSLKLHTFTAPQSGSYEGRYINGESVMLPKERCRTEVLAFLNGEE